MPVVTFLGRVFPACYQVSLSHNPLDWKWEEENLTLRFDCRLEKSVVTVACTLERYRPEYLNEIHKRAFDLVRSVLNLAAFSSGVGYSVVFESVIDTNGKKTMFALQDLALGYLCTSFSLNSQTGKTPITEIWDLVLRDLPLLVILDDLISSITIPHHAPVACARVVEGLRRLIATPRASDSQAWEQMRNALQVDRSFLKLITDTARAPRHGDWSFIPGTTVTEIIRRSWIIMDRFFHYRKRGNTPLAPTDFPLLSG
jgi:hypothetical protein